MNTRIFRRRFLLLGLGLLFVLGAVALAHGLLTGQIANPQGQKSPRLSPGPSEQVKPARSSKKAKPAEQVGRQLSQDNCSGEGAGRLTRLAMDPDDFNMITPYGLMIGGHVTPIDHQYYTPANYKSPRDAYPVYAMGDARLVLIEHRTEQPQDNDYVRTHKTDEYRLVFSQTCTFFYYYDLLTSLAPELENSFKQESQGGRTANVNIPVVAGQLIGRIGGQTLDFAVWDTDKPLSGFVVPEHYAGERWKLYTADPLDYYTPELKKIILERYPRVDEPLSGRIDWDIDGTLRGNWFLKGTDYTGDRSDRAHYWKTHLSFAPDLYDPSHFVISIGDYQGDAKQFNALGNSPNPSQVSTDSGLVKYQLVNDNYIKPNGSAWDRMTFVKGPKLKESKRVMGTVLVQLLDDRTLKFEAFPGRSAKQVDGFSANAKIYTR